MDVANESFLTSDKGCDVWEFDETENKRKLGNKEELDTMVSIALASQRCIK